jgi:mannose-6-phosphate isomerase-like protein (cupin superfamily)
VRRIFTLGVLVLMSQLAVGQIVSAKSLKPDSTSYANVYVKPLYSDSLSSSFAIWIKNEVKPHKHMNHSEVVTVIRGRAMMWVGEDSSVIKKGDVILIPKGTVHSVETLSNKPLLVVSVQAPRFVGKDRIWVK